MRNGSSDKLELLLKRKRCVRAVYSRIRNFVWTSETLKTFYAIINTLYLLQCRRRRERVSGWGDVFVAQWVIYLHKCNALLLLFHWSVWKQRQRDGHATTQQRPTISNSCTFEKEKKNREIFRVCGGRYTWWHPVHALGRRVAQRSTGAPRTEPHIRNSSVLLNRSCANPRKTKN